MRQVPIPIIKVEEVVRECSARLRNPELKERLLSVTHSLSNSEIEYEMTATFSSLLDIAPTTDIEGTISSAEMIWIYEKRLVAGTGPREKIYNVLISAPLRKKCPYCGHRDVDTLDHYLPKAHFAKLTITPFNLVPSCSKCNKEKHDSISQSEESKPIHPYFEDFESERWLYATVNQTDPIVVTFSASPPSSWDETKAARIRNHFSDLKLEELYSDEAADELSNIKQSLVDLFELGGSVALVDHLGREFRSRLSNHQNSWQTAAYDAMRASHWFINGGFQHIA